jgi:uncharacterized membrane protein
VSGFLPGGDINQEYSLFLHVASGGWNAASSQLYNVAISVGILPVIISLVSGVDGSVVLNLIYPMLFSVVPVILYKSYRQILSPRLSFLSAFLFMVYPTFYTEMTHIGRQEIAEVFLALLLLLYSLEHNLPRGSSTILTVLLTMGLLISHYSIGYIYMFVLVVAWLFSRATRNPTTSASLTITSISIVIGLAWYTYTAGGSALASLGGLFSTIASSFTNNFSSSSARPAEVNQALGLAATLSGPVHDLNRILQYVVVFFLIIGIIAIVSKKNRSLAERKIIPIMVAAFAFLVLSVVIPFLAGGLNFSRIFHIALVFLSPCFALGANAAYKTLKPLSNLFRGLQLPRQFNVKGLCLTGILVSYFLFNSGWVWAVTMDRPTSLIFDGRRMLESEDPTLKTAYFVGFNTAEGVAGAEWLRTYLTAGQSICSDDIATSHPLGSYGGERFAGYVNSTGVISAPNLSDLQSCYFSESYVFLDSENVWYGIATGPVGSLWMSDFTGNIIVKDAIYSNGGSAIYG